jgi:DNA-3-methyladenine glycosylase I
MGDQLCLAFGARPRLSVTRCGWVSQDPIYIAYHDEEWGVPNGDSRALFEKIILEGFQAGLSWITILRKREHFRRVFDNFEAAKIASYGPEKKAALLADPGIIRNRLKVDAAVDNARAYLALAEKQSLASLLWDFVNREPIQNRFTELSQVPPETPLSRAISKSLKVNGFRFVGPTTVYAMMQSVGIVNDHMTNCHRHDACASLKPNVL